MTVIASGLFLKLSNILQVFKITLFSNALHYWSRSESEEITNIWYLCFSFETNSALNHGKHARSKNKDQYNQGLSCTVL